MIIRFTGSITATVCLLVITLMLLLLIFYKAYISTLQWLLLYLMVFTIIQEACLTVGYATLFEYSEKESFCNVISIVWLCSATACYLSVFVIIIFLPYKVCEQMRGDPFPRLSRSTCFCVAMQCFFIFIVLAIPLACTLPLAHRGYLLLQPQLCNISLTRFRNLVGENSTNHVFISGLVPTFVSTIDLIGIFVITIALSVVFCRLAREYRETRITLRRTIMLLGFFVVLTIISVVFNIGAFSGMMIYLAKPDKLSKLFNGLEVLYAVVLPVNQLTFPLALLFYFYSFNLFRWRAIKRAAAEWRCFRSCCGRENAPQEAATAPGSHRVPAPSVTFFDVPHTGAFTDVTTDREEQQTLLAVSGDTGYGSVMNS